MQVVPETVGALLDQMVVLRSQHMRALPPRVERNALREHAQPQQRAQLAALARRIAAFARGMRAMEKCALGARAHLFLWPLSLAWSPVQMRVPALVLLCEDQEHIMSFSHDSVL